MRPFLELVLEIVQKNWTLGRDAALDESQCKCGHRNARCSYRGETKKPMSDYVCVIALHEANTSYCYAFEVDTCEKSVVESIEDILKQVPNDKGARRVAIDRFYNGVDNAVLGYKLGHYLYGTVRKDRGPHQNNDMDNDGELNDGEFHWRMAKLPIPMTMYSWRDSKKEGSLFLSTCHGTEESNVKRRKKGIIGFVEKTCPVAAKEYNENMGACDQSNSLRASYSVQRLHKKRWYMCMVYYGIDILLVNSFILFKKYCPENKKDMSQKKFRSSIIEAICLKYGIEFTESSASSPNKRSKRNNSGMSGIDEMYPDRSVNADHMPVYVQSRNNCKVCYAKYEGGDRKKKDKM